MKAVLSSLAAVLCLAAGLSAAQAPAPTQGPAAPAGAPAGGGRGGGVPAQLDFATAKAAADGALAAAAAANVRVAVAVVDANGDLVYFHRPDGVTGQAVTSSQGKARAAILFGVPTKAVADAAAAGTPLSATLTASGPAAQPITIQQGGLPILKAGKVIGGIGVGGSTPANDETYAKAGVDGLK